MRFFIFFIIALSSQFSHGMAPKIDWDKAVDNAIQRYGLRTEPELQRFFAHAKVAYPPKDMALLAFKKERLVELWAHNDGQPWHLIHAYPLTAFSGRLGPKLKEHDRQIPEGVYRLMSFNPYSAMHLSLLINYPNQFDRQQAIKEGRRQLGGDIFLHGKALSVGCLAVGDHAINQLFLLARRVGLPHIRVIIAPNDLRRGKPATGSFAQPRWLPELYHQLSEALRPFNEKTRYT